MVQTIQRISEEQYKPIRHWIIGLLQLANNKPNFGGTIASQLLAEKTLPKLEMFTLFS